MIGFREQIAARLQIGDAAPIQLFMPDVTFMDSWSALTVDPQNNFVQAAAVIHRQQKAPPGASDLRRIETGRPNRDQLRLNSRQQILLTRNAGSLVVSSRLGNNRIRYDSF